MICDICHKNEATVHYTEIVHNQMIKMDLCEGCAKAKGVGAQSPFSISDLLSGLAQINDDDLGFEVLSCGCCGLTLNSFRKSGRLGCSECYDVFKSAIEPLLNTLHKNIRHTGKKLGDIPIVKNKKDVLADKINFLRDSLQKAVEREEYERAAQIRDQIKEIEKELNGNGK